jgi:hypothetical protein
MRMGCNAKYNLALALLSLSLLSGNIAHAEVEEEINNSFSSVIDIASQQFKEVGYSAGDKIPREYRDDLPVVGDIVSFDESHDNSVGFWSIQMRGSVAGKDQACILDKGSSSTLAFQEDVIYSDFTGISSPITLTFNCGVDRHTGSPIYLSTNNSDPETGSGSSTLVAEFSDGDDGSGTVNIPVTVKLADNDTEIGTSQPVSSWTEGEGNKGIEVYGLISREDIDTHMRYGGSLVESSSKIYLWVK